MPFDGPITLRAEALDLLKSQLPTALAALASAAGTDLPAPDMETGYLAYLVAPPLLPSKPAVMVRLGHRRRVGEAPAFGGEYEFANEFSVDIILEGTDNEALTQQMDLYVLAVTAIFGSETALDCGQCLVDEVGYDQPQLTNRDSGDYLQDVPVFCTANTFESP